MTATTNKRVASLLEARPAQPSRLRRRRRSAAHPLWFMLPAVATFALFFLVPNLLNFGYPFTNWSAFHNDIKFIGLSNFRTVINDGSLVAALRATIVYSVLVAVFYNTFALCLALLFERDTWYNRMFRSFFFLPVLLSALAVGYIFRALLDPDGALNAVLSALLGHPVATAWLGSRTWTIVVVAAIHAWKWMGLGMLVYLAGLKSIPTDLLEAAQIDGASRFRSFWRIRFPLLAPAVTFNVATGFISTLNSFDIVQATTAGGPAESTQIFNVYMFRIFGQGLYAQASAMSLVLFLVVVLLALPIIIFLRRREQFA